MNTEEESLIFLGFRFVPYDQWLVTHLDPSWKIKQAKLWLLSKCNLSGPSQSGMPAADLDLPRYRPISPITFASGVARSRGSIDNGNGSDGEGEPGADTGDTGDDEEGDQSDGLSSNGSFEYSYGDSGRRRLKPAPSARGGGNHTIRHSISASDFRTPTPFEYKNISSRYILVAFSTGQILEDDFPVSWYNLRPYELLEMHTAGAVVSLPREIKAEYVQPYFECKVKWLRIVWDRLRKEALTSGGKVRIKVRRKRSESQITGGGMHLKSLHAEEEATSSRDSSKKEMKKRRTKFEWRERWIVVHQGMLNVCRHRTDQTPTHSYSLASLTEIRGAEHLLSYTSSSTSGAADPRIVCAKFILPVATPATATPQSMPSSPVDGVSRSTGGIGVDTEGRNAEEKPAEWSIFDMLEDNAFTSFLRVLHRHSPHTASSFLPSSFIHTTYRTSSSSPPLTPTPSPSTPTVHSKQLYTIGSIVTHPTPTQLGIVPYPEWRLDMVDRAHNAGMGDLGLAMQVALRGVSVGTPDEDISSAEDISDVEWEGWMRDLSRQRRICLQAAHKESAPGDMSSPLSSSPESDPHHVIRSLASTISPAFSSASSYDHFTTDYNHRPTIVKRSQPSAATGDGSWGNSRGFIAPTITSTVTVGNPVKSEKNARKRSSTVTAPPVGSKLLKKKDPTGFLKPNLAVATSPVSDSFEDYELVPPTTPAPSADPHPRRTSILRHVRSGSNLHRRREESEPPLPVSAPAQEEGSSAHGSAQKKRRGLVKGVSLQAEKFARGLDTALDFVDGRVGFGTI